MSGMSTETAAKPQDRLAKPTIQPQLARVKREEDEEDSQDLWISGEELYTDGSSDEEDSRAQWPSRRKINSHSSRTSSSASSADRRGARSLNPPKGSSRNIHNALPNDRFATNTTNPSKSLNDDKQESSSNTGSTYTMSCSTSKTRGTCAKMKTRTNLSNDNEQERKARNDAANLAQRANRLQDRWIISDTVDEGTMKEVLKMQELDIAIEEVYEELREATEETLSCQRENREKLRAMLELSSVESGRLAKNTQEFFALYPGCSEFLLGTL